MQLLTNPHSPGEQRTDEVRNKDLWYKAFDVKPGETLYLAARRSRAGLVGPARAD